MNHINIFFSANRNVIDQVQVMLSSLLIHTTSRVHAFICVRDVYESNLIDNFLQISQFKNFSYEIIVYEISLKIISQRNDFFPVEASFRLFLSDIFRERDMKRILHLDTDIIFTDDVWDLFSYEFSTAIAAAEDLYSGKFLKRILYQKQLVKIHKYINAGVILFNMDILKSEFPQAHINILLEKYYLQSRTFDQDLLNIIFSNHVTILPSRWNWLPHLTRFFGHPKGIIHFAGKWKCDSIFYPKKDVRELYFGYLHRKKYFDVFYILFYFIIVYPLFLFDFSKNNLHYNFYALKFGNLFGLLLILYPPCTFFLLKDICKDFSKYGLHAFISKMKEFNQ